MAVTGQEPQAPQVDGQDGDAGERVMPALRRAAPVITERAIATHPLHETRTR